MSSFEIHKMKTFQISRMAEISHFHCQAMSWQTALKTTEEDIEELQEVTASLAPAKEISEEATVAAGGGQEKQRTSLKAFLMGNMFLFYSCQALATIKTVAVKTVGHHN